MFGSTQLFEVYHHPQLPQEDATALVRQGFSVPAFLFHVGWLFYQRLWIEAVLFLALYAGAVYVGQQFGLSEIAIGLIQLALQFWLATNAADVRAQALERKGFALTDIVSGKSLLEAERHYYYTHKHA